MECKSGKCEIEEHATCSCDCSETECNDCGCGTSDPVKYAMEKWHNAFHEAFHQAQVERLKKRIDATLGPMLDKAADAMFETAVKVYQSQAAESEAKKELELKLQKIISEISKR